MPVNTTAEIIVENASEIENPSTASMKDSSIITISVDSLSAAEDEVTGAVSDNDQISQHRSKNLTFLKRYMPLAILSDEKVKCKIPNCRMSRRPHDRHIPIR